MTKSFISVHPLLVTTIDAEEAFDWYGPLVRENCDVGAMNEQYLAHRIFKRHGICPTYFVTYPVVNQKGGYEFLEEILRDGSCEIGAQLHSWVTPPFVEEVSSYNSFAGNLPEALEYEKLKILTDAIEGRFGVRPTFYRAGRYGLGPNSVRTLAKLGYEIDCSVLPEFSYADEGGPNFIGVSGEPRWLNGEKRLLELPLTSGFVGLLARTRIRDAPLPAMIFRRPGRHIIARGLLARLGLVERIKLSPEGTTISEARRLVHALLRRGGRVFTLSYHTPSLVPGNTPYVRSFADRGKLLSWLEMFYDFFIGELGGMPIKTSELLQLARMGRIG